MDEKKCPDCGGEVEVGRINFFDGVARVDLQCFPCIDKAKARRKLTPDEALRELYEEVIKFGYSYFDVTSQMNLRPGVPTDVRFLRIGQDRLDRLKAATEACRRAGA